MFVLLLTALNTHFIYHLVCQFDLKCQNMRSILTIMATQKKTKKPKNVL